MASVGLRGRPLDLAKSPTKAIPREVFFLAGTPLGMGIAMAVASFLGRAVQPDPPDRC